MTPRTRPREREGEILDATRALFDEHGVDDVRVARIARVAGINKALIYRHFSSKEELFVLTVTRYLAEIERELTTVDAGALGPEDALAEITDRYAAYCLRHPAFLDLALLLMRRPFAQLAARVSDGVLLRLGRAMAGCLGPTAAVLAEGTRRNAFAVQDPDRGANHLYTQALGTLHLARLGVGLRRAANGAPETFPVDPGSVRRAVVEDALAHARGGREADSVLRGRRTTA